MKRLLLIIIVSATFAGCQPENDAPTFYSCAALFEVPADPFEKQLKNLMDSLVAPAPSYSVIFDSSWQFVRGNSSEGIHTNASDLMGSEVVNLPHRILAPDTPLWYKKVVYFPEPGFHMVHADDGAQLYIDDRPVKRYDGIIFPITMTGRHTLIVRVLNNAMEGGLNRVAFLTMSQFRKYEQELSAYRSNVLLLQKVLLLRNGDPQLIQNAIRSVREKDEDVLQALKDRLHGYPYFLGPFVQEREGKISVSVEMERVCEVKLSWGPSKENLENEMVSVGKLVRFELPALSENQQYFYRLSAGKSLTDIYSFQTEKTSGEFTFNVWGDSQSGWQAFYTNIRNSAKNNDAFGVAVGDLVSNGSDSVHWKMFLSILSLSGSGRPYYLVAGNHDYDGFYDDLVPRWYRHYTKHDPAYFMWTYGNSAFIALDPNTTFPIGTDSLQRKWFLQQIQSGEWKQATWRFVFLHQTLYSEGWPGYEGDIVLREWLEPYIETAQIDFVISGHTHDYERMTRIYGNQKTTFLVVGGGGGGIEPDGIGKNLMDTVIRRHHFGRFKINGSGLHFEAIDLNNNIMDSLTSGKTLNQASILD